MLVVFASLLFLAVRTVYPFLAVSDLPQGGILVAEGWLPDYALVVVNDEFHRHPYDAVYSTGGPLERGGFLAQYENYAELSAATLIALGVPQRQVFAVPSPRVLRDRTYTSALALHRWLQTHNLNPEYLTVVTIGPHARRTRMCFQKAFGEQTTVSVIAVASNDYDERYWWKYSEGLRSVLGEAIAYVYVHFYFMFADIDVSLADVTQ